MFKQFVANQLFMASLLFPLALYGQEREWSDSTGQFQMTAELVVSNGIKAILRKENGELVSFNIDELSDADKNYIGLKTEEASAIADQSSNTWDVGPGIEVQGRLVGFVERTVTIRRFVGKLYVDDEKYENLPEMYRNLIPLIVSHNTNDQVSSAEDLNDWIKKQPLGKKSIQCNGVLMELENGDQFAIPLFLFSDPDAGVLQSGWQRWHDAKEEKWRDEESLYLRAQSLSRSSGTSQHGDKSDQVTEVQRLRQIAEVSLQLEAYDAGLFDLWEIQLLPPVGSYASWQSVIVPGRNSQQAAQSALQKYPDYNIGAIVKLRRRR